MKALLLLATLSLCACAKPADSSSTTFDDSSKAQVCVDPKDVDQIANLVSVSFPDGSVRKAIETSCTDGCERYTDANGPDYITSCPN